MTLRESQIFDLIRDTFHGGRKNNAVVRDSLCSYPELLEGPGWYGFRCWQRRRSDGLYRRVQSTHARGRRTTFLGAWVERFPQSQPVAVAA